MGMTDVRHRAIRHHSESIFVLGEIFGTTITISTERSSGEIHRGAARTERPQEDSPGPRLAGKNTAGELELRRGQALNK